MLLEGLVVHRASPVELNLLRDILGDDMTKLLSSAMQSQSRAPSSGTLVHHGHTVAQQHGFIDVMYTHRWRSSGG